MATIGQKLERLLASQHVSQAAFARRVGVSPATMNDYIRRGAEPMSSIAFRMAGMLRVSADWLLDDAADFPPPAIPDPDAAEQLAREVVTNAARTLPRDRVLRLAAFASELAAPAGGDDDRADPTSWATLDELAATLNIGTGYAKGLARERFATSGHAKKLHPPQGGKPRWYVRRDSLNRLRFIDGPVPDRVQRLMSEGVAHAA